MRLWVALGGLNAFLSVLAGAFGAHALKSRLAAPMLEAFETAARYQFLHALGLLAVGWMVTQGLRVEAAGWLMTAGIVLFSGSLYALGLSGIRPLGAITPLGGLCFLAAWAAVVWAAVRPAV